MVVVVEFQLAFSFDQEGCSLQLEIAVLNAINESQPTKATESVGSSSESESESSKAIQATTADQGEQEMSCHL